MNTRAARILAVIHALEADFELELARGRLEFCYTVENSKVRFEEKIIRYHKRLRRHWLTLVAMSAAAHRRDP